MPRNAQPKKTPAAAKELKDPRHVAMIEALSQGATWEEAAKRVGVHRKTMYLWCKADPDLAAQAMEARDTADDMVEFVMFQNCLDPDPAHNTLRMFWLKCRRRETYQDTSKHLIEDARKSYDVANTPDDL